MKRIIPLVITHKFRRQLDCRLLPQSNCGRNRLVGNHRIIPLLTFILLAVWTFLPTASVRADMGPHPTMDFELAWTIPRVSVAEPRRCCRIGNGTES